MKRYPLIILAIILISSCSNVTTGFEMIGEFKDGKYINDFSIDSRYWPSFVMVIPENTDLTEKKFEAVAIFNDYGVLNEQNPVGYNISHFTQNGITAKRKTIFAIEDDPDVSLFLDDANAESVAYSTYNDDLGLYEVFIQGIEGGDNRLVASGDGDKLNSYASVVGKEIFWTELDGDEISIMKGSLTGDKEEVIYYENAYGFLLESNGSYIAYYIEEFDEDYNLLSNDVIIYDVNANKVVKTFEVDSDLELTSGNYDGESVFFTAYDYANENYLYSKLLSNGDLEVYKTDDENVTTFTGSGDQVMAMKALSGARSDFYEADVYHMTSGDEEHYTDLLNSGFYNDYLFYVECDVNSNYLIDDISLHITKGK